MRDFEIRPKGTPSPASGVADLVWPSARESSDSIKSNIDPWLTQFGEPSSVSIDLVRIATGAYFADRLSPRGVGFSRTINLRVRLVEPAPWETTIDSVCDLLHWVTGDSWNIELSSDGLKRPMCSAIEANSRVKSVSLFSGGLDSLCGALVHGKEPRLLLGHWDNSTVKAAQNRTYAWLRSALTDHPPYFQVHLTHTAPKREPSSRSRSLLFLSLAAAAAEGYGAERVVVPENGFTSLNPPLGAERGGALSTRSTHPSTIHRMNEILSRLLSPVRIENPHAGMTKGELVQQAASVCGDDFVKGAAETLSCGKLDGRLYRGGNPNHHCGLCVPCLVRRGSLLAASVADETPYLCHYLIGDAHLQLVNRRADDVSALRFVLEERLDDTTVMALGPFPPDFDLDAACDLCARGLDELQLVQLP